MIARVWRTGVDAGRGGEYEAFAVGRSLPMFKRQGGCRGVFFVRTETGRAVITLWRDEAAVKALGGSADYLETVAAIEAAGFLVGAQEVELMPVDEAWIAAGS